jgi:membrane-associated phospholipid phosphatase
MRQKIAVIISGLLNPFVVSFFTIILVVEDTTDSLSGALKWTAIALALSVAPVFFFILWQVRRKKLASLFPEQPEQRKMIYLLASVMAAVGGVVMWRFKAPEMLEISFIAGLAAVIVFMIINNYWKISLHTAFVSAAALMLTETFGARLAWLFLLLPLVGWARLELRLHTPAQLIAGAALAAAILSGVLWGFGVF